MTELSVVEVLRRIDGPAEPRREFADALLASLLEGLEQGSGAEPAEAPAPHAMTPRQRVPQTPRRRWVRVAIAAAAAFAVAIGLVILRLPSGRPTSAAAVMREARAAFEEVPPFHAVITKRTPGEWLADEAPDLERPVPDRVFTREVAYLDRTHFRTTITDVVWDVEGPDHVLAQIGDAEGTAWAADGEYFATYRPTDGTLTVEPIADPRDLAFFAAGELMPRIEVMADPSDEYLEQHCELLPDETMFGRTVRRIHCTDPGFRQYEGGPTLDVDTYVDAETGMLFKMASRNEGVWFQVDSIDFEPGYSADDFQIQIPDGTAIQWLGDGAPPERFRPQVDASVTSIPVGNVPEAVSAGAGSIWVTYTQGGTGGDGEGGRQAVARIDPATSEVIARIVAPTELTEIPKHWASPLVFVQQVLPTDDAVYIAYHDAGNGGPPVRIAAIDPRTNQLGPPLLTLDRRSDGFYGAFMAYADDALWVCDSQGGEKYEQIGGHTWPLGALLKIDPTTGEELTRIPFEGNCGKVFVVGDSLWFRGTVPDRDDWIAGVFLFEVDTATGDVATYPIPEGAGDTTYGDGTIWITDYQEKVLYPFDVEARQLGDPIDTGVPTGIGDAAVASGEGYVWETNSSANSLLMIDPLVGEVIESIEVGASPLFLTVADGSVWVANYRDATVSRVPI